MKKSMIITLIGILIISTFVFITGCKKKETICKIGIITIKTGSHAIYGNNVTNGVLLAIEEINSNGGINGKIIIPIIEDEGAEPKLALSSYRKLVDIDKVSFIIGPASSNGVMTVAPSANNDKVIILSPGAGSPNISNAGEFIFRNRASGTTEAKAISSFAIDSLRIKNVSVFQIQTDYGEGFVNVFEDQIKKNGIQILRKEYFNVGDVDFRTQLTKLRKDNPDALYIVGVPIEVGYILKQMAELNIKTNILTNNMRSDELINIAGDRANGIFYAIPDYNPNSSNSTIISFNKKYKSKYNKNSDMFAANGYDAIYIYADCIKNNKNSNITEIRDYLLNSTFNVVNGGLINFDKNGDVEKKINIESVVNGKFVTIR